MASANAREAMLTVKTSVRRMLRPVSLKRMSGWFSTPGARIGGQAIEEAERRCANAALGVDRGHERDRPRHDCSDNQLVSVARRQFAKVERDITGFACVAVHCSSRFEA